MTHDFSEITTAITATPKPVRDRITSAIEGAPTEALRANSVEAMRRAGLVQQARMVDQPDPPVQNRSGRGVSNPATHPPQRLELRSPHPGDVTWLVNGWHWAERRTVLVRLTAAAEDPAVALQDAAALLRTMHPEDAVQLRGVVRAMGAVEVAGDAITQARLLAQAALRATMMQVYTPWATVRHAQPVLEQVTLTGDHWQLLYALLPERLGTVPQPRFYRVAAAGGVDADVVALYADPLGVLVAATADALREETAADRVRVVPLLLRYCGSVEATAELDTEMSFGEQVARGIARAKADRATGELRITLRNGKSTTMRARPAFDEAAAVAQVIQTCAAGTQLPHGEQHLPYIVGSLKRGPAGRTGAWVPRALSSAPSAQAFAKRAMWNGQEFMYRRLWTLPRVAGPLHGVDMSVQTLPGSAAPLGKWPDWLALLVWDDGVEHQKVAHALVVANCPTPAQAGAAAAAHRETLQAGHPHHLSIISLTQINHPGQHLGFEHALARPTLRGEEQLWRMVSVCDDNPTVLRVDDHVVYGWHPALLDRCAADHTIVDVFRVQ